MKKTTVLIVGAGPTGLMMACQLAAHEIPFIIVEKSSGPTTQSRALGIQARTLEIFAQMGIIDRFISEGYPAKGLDFIANGKPAQHIPLSGLGHGLTEFPYMLMLEQSRTERILIDFLKKHNHTIHWNTEVISFDQTAHGVTAILNQNQTEEKITSDWIIGADGAHSIVRHTLKIPLQGNTYKQSLFVLDCKIDSPLLKKDIAVSTSDKAFAAFFPLSHDRWRIVGEIPDTAIGKDTITFEEVEKDFAQRLRMKITLSDPAWISLYHAHHRCVSHFREKRAFLLGDAAHIHSPVGAQGMNTGLQDAYNLAWKIAFVHQGKAKPTILDTYNTERLPFARRLVETTDRMFNLFISRKRLAILTREYILPFIAHIAISHKFTGQKAFRTVSQLIISYHTSPLSRDAISGQFPSSAPKPGDRLPYIVFKQGQEEVSLQRMISPTAMTLLLFPGKVELLPLIIEESKRFDSTIHIEEIALSTETASLYKELGIEHSGYYLVRPDMYIAYRDTSSNSDNFSTYLSEFFVKTESL